MNLRQEIKTIRKTQMEMLEKKTDQQTCMRKKHEACPT